MQTLKVLSNKVLNSNETEDLNLYVFNMITEITLSQTLTKHISCKYQGKFHDTKSNL